VDASGHEVAYGLGVSFSRLRVSLHSLQTCWPRHEIAPRMGGLQFMSYDVIIT
jgi:hypothetical protein